MHLYNSFWKIKAFPSARVTTWRVLENKITTKVNLARCGVVVESILCCLCVAYGEITSYLFFYCRIAWLAWNLCYSWLGLNSVNHHASASHFLQFNLSGAPTSVNLVLRTIWIVLVSEIWRHRNRHIFKGELIDYSEIFSMTHLKVGSWVTSKIPSACFSFSDWCFDPLVCMFSIKNK